jgi:outer membrane lipase/esterase
MVKQIKVFFILLFLLSGITEAKHFPDEIIMIGDSLSDSGNSGPVIGFFARFAPITDGVPWIVLLSEKLETKDFKPSVQGGTNFAYVGAETSSNLLTISLNNQIDLIPKNTGRGFPVFVWGGANNIFFSSSPHDGEAAAIDISNILQRLHDMKFKTLVSLNLPDLGYLPSAGSQSAAYREESLEFSQVWVRELKKKNFPIIAINVASIFDLAIKNPSKFGFFHPISSNPSPSPAFPMNEGNTTAGYMFWYDGTHPTEATHKMISDYVFSILTAPYCYGSLADEPFGVLREQRSAIHQQLFPEQPLHSECKIYPFIGGNYSPLLSLPRQDFGCEKEPMGGNVVVGFTDRICDWTLGIAGNYAFHSMGSDGCENGCKFDLHTATASFFSGFNKSCGYMNAIFDFAYLIFDDIKRKFVIGPVYEKAHGHTKGMDFDGEIYGAYYFWHNCSFRTGPLIDLNYQKVFIDGYKEAGAEAGNLKYKDQNNSIFVTGLGWEAGFRNCVKQTTLVTDLFLTFNRQWLNGERTIRFREVSVPDIWGAWPIKRHRMNFISTGINFSSLFQNGTIFSLGYTFNGGTFNTEEHFINAGITLPLGHLKK